MTGICTRCLTPTEGFTLITGGAFSCLPCARFELGDDLVDEIVLYEHPELVDDAMLDRIATGALDDAPAVASGLWS